MIHVLPLIAGCWEYIARACRWCWGFISPSGPTQITNIPSTNFNCPLAHLETYLRHEFFELNKKVDRLRLWVIFTLITASWAMCFSSMSLYYITNSCTTVEVHLQKEKQPIIRQEQEDLKT